MPEDPSDDIRDVRKQESMRGKGYSSSREERAQWKRRQKQWRDILQAMTWEEVVSELSLQQDSEQYAQMRKIWLQYRRNLDEGA